MKCRKFILICLLCTSVGLMSVEAYSLPNEIREALEKADAKSLSKHFNSSLEVVIGQTQGVYGKSQAEQILKNFFENNNGVDGFKYKDMHESSKENTQFYIGQLYTAKGNYRIYIYMKAVGSSFYIHQMRIESND